MAENKLFVVATPIGNLADISQRAIDVLASVDLIAAEDTRHSSRLLGHLGIRKPLWAVHDHNESQAAQGLVNKLKEGLSIALVSDAGTPLIADPGFHVLKAIVEAGFEVVPVPGPCAVITALCASALPTDRFIFDGFLPAKQQARQQYFSEHKEQDRTLVVYESTHRIVDSLQDMQQVLGAEREIVLGRELTKTFETFIRGNIAEVRAKVEADHNQQKGEFVVMIRGYQKPEGEQIPAEVMNTLRILAEELPLKKAAALAAKLTGYKKNQLYQAGLDEKDA
ncbi:MAG: 16S rRNA (cytidine(1402)-2'-O)-methyltransferase [Oceanospirillaceae bacterium]|nr:16S rRNA (cytidine(1402)-2'-O)-methyltransferase [Oceanospirillaceae bacterium]